MGAPDPNCCVMKRHLNFDSLFHRSWEECILPALALPPASRCSVRYLADDFSLITTPARFGVLPQRAFRNILVPHVYSPLSSPTHTRRISTSTTGN